MLFPNPCKNLTCFDMDFQQTCKNFPQTCKNLTQTCQKKTLQGVKLGFELFWQKYVPNNRVSHRSVSGLVSGVKNTSRILLMLPNPTPGTPLNDPRTICCPTTVICEKSRERSLGLLSYRTKPECVQEARMPIRRGAHRISLRWP